MLKENTNLLEKNTLRILVYTASFINDDTALTYFSSLAKYKQFSIYYMPMKGYTEINGVCTGRYEHIKEKYIIYTSIEFDDCSGYVGSHHEINGVVFSELSDESLNKMTENIILTGNTYAAPFDLVVVSDAWAIENATIKNKVFSFADFREFLRLYMVYTKQFYVSPHRHIDEFSYYLYRHKVVFCQFQSFWRSAHSDPWFSYADALDNRLLHFVICIDNIKILLINKQNNVTAMHLQYHLSYMTLLVTGTFDNLAWLINDKYELNLHRMKIDLMKSEFIDNVRAKSSELADFFAGDIMQDKIKAIREIRDRIVHRDFIHTIRVKDNSDSEENCCLFIDPLLKDKLINAGFPERGFPIIINPNACMDIGVFVDFVNDTLTKIVNTVLKIINKEIYDTEEEICIWEMFNFPNEPDIM